MPQASCRKLKLFCVALVMMIGEFTALQANAESRDYLVALPLITLGRPAITKAEINLKDQATMALEWTYLGKAEELYKREIETRPNDSLMSQGQELGLSFSRFSQPNRMAGLFWTLGAGYRRLQADWRKAPLSQGNDQVRDELGQVSHGLDIAGATLTWRFGYRYVASSLGFAAGIHLGIKHFQNHVHDRKDKGEDGATAYSPIARHDKLALQRRLMSTLQPGIELGWAF